ncbi:ADP-ribosylglycohydrolase family protein [Nocardia spumae]|uniref:ADP-ribosylglycohydrolase family protein n=1 Tax=Nocardia spumae TaxID=2887190 RepID=UPI001D14171C|nr:ADP-ribosylglycohydrolase family protein [Nocardia spumae]
MRDHDIVYDRYRGVLLGGAVGDALGWPIEFLKLAQIRDRFGADGLTDFAPSAGDPAPKQITDDTQMTLFTAEGLLRCAPGADPAPVLRRAYLRWLRTQREHLPEPTPDGWLAGLPYLYAVRAPGNACMGGLNRQAGQFIPPHPFGTPGPVNPDSKGCGTVMRSAPFGLAALGPEVAFEWAARCAQLTHGHPTGYLAAGAFAAVIDRVVNGADVRTAVHETVIQAEAVPGGGETAAALRKAVSAADAGPGTSEGVEVVGEGWVAEECLAVAVYCALDAARTGDLRRALLLSVNHSGDSDSTGAVTGNLLGACYGLTALPLDWCAAVEGRDDLARVADDLVANFVYGDRAPLGSRYPVEAAEDPVLQ